MIFESPQVDVLLRERRDLASAQAFFRRVRATAETRGYEESEGRDVMLRGEWL